MWLWKNNAEELKISDEKKRFRGWTLKIICDDGNFIHCKRLEDLACRCHTYDDVDPGPLLSIPVPSMSHL